MSSSPEKGHKTGRKQIATSKMEELDVNRMLIGHSQIAYENIRVFAGFFLS